MKNEIFDELKEDYFEKSKKNEKNKRCLDALKQRRDFLKKNALIQQYLDLDNQIKDYKRKVFSDKEILDSTLSYFDEVTEYDETFEVYLYLGSFIYDDYDIVAQIARNDKHDEPDYNIYANIESKEILVLDYADCYEFENTHDILVVDELPDYNLLYDVRDEYFKDAFENGQDKAMEKVLKRIK